MEREIESVAVLGAGTMGSGIAAACAQAGCPVLLLDVNREAADKAVARMRRPRPGPRRSGHRRADHDRRLR